VREISAALALTQGRQQWRSFRLADKPETGISRIRSVSHAFPLQSDSALFDGNWSQGWPKSSFPRCACARLLARL